MKHLLENVRRSRVAVIGLGVLISLIAFAPMALSRPGPESSLALTIAGLDDADDCKQGGWMTYKVFKNQGDCVSYVVTGGRNLPSGTTVPTSTTLGVPTTTAPTTTTTTLVPTTTTTLAPTTTTTLIAGLNSKDQCKNGGWVTFGVFKNQGDCVSFVATGGANPPDGP